MHRTNAGRTRKNRGSRRVKRIKDEATRLSQKMALRSLKGEILDIFKDAFKKYDTYGDGSIVSKNLAKILKDLGLPITREMLNNIIIEMDADGNGDIPFEDFAAVMATKMYFPHSVNAFREACKMFDDNDNGKLYVSDLRFAMEEVVPFPMSYEETDYMVNHINFTNGETDIEKICQRMEDSIRILETINSGTTATRNNTDDVIRIPEKTSAVEKKEEEEDSVVVEIGNGKDRQ